MKRENILKMVQQIALVILILLVISTVFVVYYNITLPYVQEAAAQLAFEEILIVDHGDAVVGLYEDDGKVELTEINTAVHQQTNAYTLFEDWDGTLLYTYQNTGIVFFTRNSSGHLCAKYYQPFKYPKSLTEDEYLLEEDWTSQLYVREDGAVFSAKDADDHYIIGIVQNSVITVDNLSENPLFAAGIQSVRFPSSYKTEIIPYIEVELSTGVSWYMGGVRKNGKFPCILSTSSKDDDMLELGTTLYADDKYVLLPRESGVIRTLWKSNWLQVDSGAGESGYSESPESGQSPETEKIVSQPGSFDGSPLIYNLSDPYSLVIGRDGKAPGMYKGYLYNTSTDSVIRTLDSLLNENISKNAESDIQIHSSLNAVYIYDGFSASSVLLEDGDIATIQISDYRSFIDNKEEPTGLENFFLFMGSIQAFAFFVVLSSVLILSVVVYILIKAKRRRQQ